MIFWPCCSGGNHQSERRKAWLLPVRKMSENKDASLLMKTSNSDDPSGITDTTATVTTTPRDNDRDPSSFLPQNDIPGSNSIDVTSAVASNCNDTNQRPWDFSNRKVMVQGVDKFHDVKTSTKMVQKWLEEKTESPIEFVVDKIKKPPKSTWMTITLQSEAMVQPFIEYINSSSIRNRKGNKIFAKPQLSATDQDSGRRRSRDDDETMIHGVDDNENDDHENYEMKAKRQRQDTESPNDGTANHDRVKNSIARRPITLEELKDRIIPLWKLPTQEQLQYKMKEMIKKCAMKIVNEIKSKFRSLGKEKSRTKIEVYPWILQQRCIDVQPIVAAPTPLRNKCEFTFGYQYLWPSPECDSATQPLTKPSCGGDTSNLDLKGVPMLTDSAATEQRPLKIPAVGFMVTGWAGGVSFSNSLQNIPNEAGAVVNIVNDFLAESTLAPYDCTTHRGFWRILTLRTSRRTQECMIIIQHNSPSSAVALVDPELGTSTSGEGSCVTDWTAVFATEKARLISLLVDSELPTESSLPPVKVTSIFFQEFSGLSNPPPEHPVQHAYGKKYLTEQLGSCTFQISPGAFFQVNTEGAEILYQLVVDKVREVSPDPAQTLLFDVCCGTGTIGLTCLKAGVVGEVVGVDISAPAIMDARMNASVNGYGTSPADESNEDNESSATRFVTSRAELVLGREIHKVKQRQRQNDGTTKSLNFVAVVDPAREGLHADVIKAIRCNNEICRLVYVSCNPTATLVRDAALLCSPPTKRYTGRPFQITSATPVDMFPLTNHCEMVMTFDRLSDEEMKTIVDGGNVNI